MSGFKSYSTTPASNTFANTGVHADEGQLPSTVNDGVRQFMADARTDYVAREWRDFGDTPTFVSTASFTVSGDQTANYVANRPIRCTDATTLYGIVSSSSFSTNTTVNVTLDSGSLSTSLSAVALGIDPSQKHIPGQAIRGPVDFAAAVNVASAASPDIFGAASNNVRITGTTTITSFATASAGIVRKVRFAAALTLTHNATSLILPGSANITTAADDTAEFLSLGSGNAICLWYKRASGLPIVSGNVEVFTSSGTFTAKTTGTHLIIVTAGGGSGGGGDGSVSQSGSGGGGGGGSGETIVAQQTLTAAVGYTVTVGTGATAAAATADGNAGNNSAFVGTSTVTAHGGSGGKKNSLTSGGAGGAAGTTATGGAAAGTGGVGAAAAGTLSGSGGAGGTGDGTTTGGAGGGGGGESFWGPGGAGGTGGTGASGVTAGTAGTNYGSGGGGGGGSGSNGTGLAGGAGANGIVFVIW